MPSSGAKFCDSLFKTEKSIFVVVSFLIRNIFIILSLNGFKVPSQASHFTQVESRKDFDPPKGCITRFNIKTVKT